MSLSLRRQEKEQSHPRPKSMSSLKPGFIRFCTDSSPFLVYSKPPAKLGPVRISY